MAIVPSCWPWPSTHHNHTRHTPGEGEEVLVWDYIEGATYRGKRSGIYFVTEKQSYNLFEKGGLEGLRPSKNPFFCAVTATKWP
jgi:hypothetical protein